MKLRREVAEHPFGTIKWLMSTLRFFVRGLLEAKAEPALTVTSYNLKRLIAIKGVAAAYAVQETNTEYRLRSGRRLVGRKIGLTSKAAQAQFGVGRPDYGMLFDDMDVPHGEKVDLHRVFGPVNRSRKLPKPGRVSYTHQNPLGAEQPRDGLSPGFLTRLYQDGITAISQHVRRAGHVFNIELKPRMGHWNVVGPDVATKT